jgi:hypothetical protein
MKRARETEKREEEKEREEGGGKDRKKGRQKRSGSKALWICRWRAHGSPPPSPISWDHLPAAN